MAVDRDLLAEFLRIYPFQPATAWWRAIEVGHLLGYPLPGGRGLDVGCGDGSVAQIVSSRSRTAERTWIGIDVDPAEVELARGRSVYAEVLAGRADCIDRPDAHFDFALSNSVLEHLPHIDPVLCEVSRVLKPGAPFLFTVPSVQFHDCLRGPSALRRVMLRQERIGYLQQIDDRLAHRNYWDEAHWQRSLNAAGFADATFSPYFRTAEVQRWETLSNLTAGVLYTLFRSRPPIEIQRSLGLRRSASMPHRLAGVLADSLNARMSQGPDSMSGGLMVVAKRGAGECRRA